MPSTAWLGATSETPVLAGTELLTTSVLDGGLFGEVEVLGGGVELLGGEELLGGGEVRVLKQPVCAGLVRPMPWLRSHSYPALASEPPGN